MVQRVGGTEVPTLPKRGRCARKALVPYGSHLIIQLGINDLDSPSFQHSPSQTISDIMTIVALARPNQKRYKTTITPHSSSTDGWITVGNQTTTISGFNTQPNHASLNQTIRAGVSGFTGFYDTASALENTQDSAIWKAPSGVAQTGDGLHPNQTGYALVQSSGVIPIPVYP
jgi:lysophospholipase L1-like esterase